MFVRSLRALATALLLLVVSACDLNSDSLFRSKSDASDLQELLISGSALGTSYHIKLLLPAGSEQAFSQDTLGDDIQALIDHLDRSMSTYKPDSELNQFNRHPIGEPFAVSAELLEVLLLAKQIHGLTGGAFDPTIAPLVDLWGFGPRDTGDRVPSDAEISALREVVNFDALVIQVQDNTSDAENTFTKTSEVTLDLSAIAKGYIVDRIASFLLDLGVENFLVELGGELRLEGHNARDEFWKIAVEVPVLEQGQIQRVLSLTKVGLATSGDYRNYFERDGERYSHTIDPRKGYPITHKLASVTVLAPTAAEADAFATGFMVMGKDEALSLAETLDLPVLLLVKDAAGFKEYYTKAFQPYLVGELDGEK